jgi:phage shock protein A
MAQNDPRLDRIEEKIDKLSEAMVSLARTEEKILSMEQNHRNHYERMNRFSEKLDSIERKVNDNKNTVDLINKIAMTALVTIVASSVKFFWF